MDPLEEGKTGTTENTGNVVENSNTTIPASNPSKAKTEEVDVSKLNQENKDTIQVDWGASEKGKENAFFQGPTKKVPEGPKAPSGSTSTQPPISGPSFELGIKILIAVIDFIMSNILWKIAGEGKSSSYTADPESKKNLQDSLILLIGETRIKMPPWLVCLFAFLAAYGIQILAAIDARKNKSQKKADDKNPLEPGLFEKDGKMFRRYANGNVREARFDPQGNEIVIGQPPKLHRRRAA